MRNVHQFQIKKQGEDIKRGQRAYESEYRKTQQD